MDKLKSKHRAVGLLLVFASILVLVAAWDFPEGSPNKVDQALRVGEQSGW